MEEHHDEKQKGHKPVKFSSPACSFTVTKQAGYKQNNKNCHADIPVPAWMFSLKFKY